MENNLLKLYTMNLSERLRVDKELFSGERSSYENTEKNKNFSVFS